MDDQQHPYTDDDGQSLAIVGLAFEFPQGVTSVDSFWQMVCDGRSVSSEFPPDRFNIDAFYHPDGDRPSTIPLRGGHFLEEDLAVFDAPFFSITPNEAACMDPQHRRMLEAAYHALEDAGIPIEKCAGSSTSVYTGCFTNDYLSILHQDFEAEQRQAAMGLVPSMLANRLSWFFNFKGTSMNLDSACSSSLVALHLACQDLRAGHSSMALVGGANLVYHPNFMKTMSDFNFLSPDSRCWSFDERANGYARGEGLAVLVVKRLQDALRDNDTIRAVIRNTGSNQDGRTPGITQPNGDAQVDLIKNTYRERNIDMEPTRFFQAHATGTQVGDVIEGNAIGCAFDSYRTVDDPLYLGAIKANIGHLEGCSGLAGVITTILVLEKGLIPPIAGFQKINKKIDARQLPLHFPTQSILWPAAPVRRACVNSFGFGGTNALVILDDAYNFLRLRGLQGNHRTQCTSVRNGIQNGHQSTDLSKDLIKAVDSINNGATSLVNGHSSSNKANLSNGILHARTNDSSTKSILLNWSAPNEQGAERLNDQYAQYMKTRAVDFEYEGLSYHLAERRSQFSWRSFAVVDSSKDAIEANFFPSKPTKAHSSPRVAFVFTGQGAQYPGMGCGLLSNVVFRDSIERCGELLQKLGCPWSPLAIFGGELSNLDMNAPELSQPLTTILQIGIVDILHSLGIIPSVVMGHSSGEVAAAYAAGALSRESAVKVAYYRGVLSSGLASTTKSLTMMAVGLAKIDVEKYLARVESTFGTLDVQVGCVNSPKSITLTGKTDQLATLEEWLKLDGVFARIMRVPMAYHSRFMEAIAKDYADSISDIHVRPNTSYVPMISSVTGDFVRPETLSSAQYWVTNLTSTVEFESAINKLLMHAGRKPRRQLGKQNAMDISTLTHVLEIGPHGALQGPLREILQAHASSKLQYVSSLVRGKDPSFCILELVGTLHCAGFTVDLLRANGLEKTPAPLAPPDMPLYPFNHSQRYWTESSLSRNLRFRETPRHDLLGTRALDWNPQMAVWRNVMRLRELPWLEDHKIGSNAVLPAAGLVAMVIQAHQELFSGSEPCQGICLENVSFSHAVAFPPGVDQAETQLTLAPTPQTGSRRSWSEFRLFVLESQEYIECARGLVRAVVAEADVISVCSVGPGNQHSTLQSWIETVRETSSRLVTNPYRALEGTELRYGPTFRNLDSVRVGAEGQVTAKVNSEMWKITDPGWNTVPYVVHPTTLDGVVQSALQSLLAQRPDDLPTLMPTHVDKMWIGYSTNEESHGIIDVVARSKFLGNRGGLADIVATSNNSHRPLVYIDGLQTSFVSAKEPCVESVQRPRRLCMKLSWKSDIDAMTSEQALTYCTRERPHQAPNSKEIYQSQKIAILCFIEDALRYLDQNPGTRMERHLESYVEWMRYQRQRLSGNDPESLTLRTNVEQLLKDPEARDHLNHAVEHAPGDGFFFMKIGYNILQMLRGEIDPLNLIFQDGLADRYYQEMLDNDHHAYPASEIIDLMSFKNPSMKILEVGAGTGGQTMRFLKTMGHDGVNKWAQYDYTDVSPGFFTRAREKFQPYLDNMVFKVCDISKDPVCQGFEADSYDLVIASHVLHATNKLRDSLRNIRRLLKPTGKFLLFETTDPEAIPIGFAFGLLKGWWQPLDHESRSAHSPCVNVEQWDALLKDTGFTGVDVNIPGQEEPYCRTASILISTAASSDIANPPARLQQAHLVIDDQIEIQRHAAQTLQHQIRETMGASSEICTLKELGQSEIPKDNLVILLIEVDAVFLGRISEADYEILQASLLRSKNILWVTRAGLSTTDMMPEQHLASGLGRTLMSEDSAFKFVHLELQQSDTNLESELSIIIGLVQNIVGSSTGSLETNYKVVQDTLHICRIGEYSIMDEHVARAVTSRHVQEVYVSSDFPLELQVSPGHLGTVEWAETETEATDEACIGPSEVEVQVKAIGLTFRDHLVAKSLLSETDIGSDCAGVVLRAGTQSGFAHGDRVCFISTSTARSMVRIHADAVVAIPSRLSLIQAASIPTAQWLAYHGLVNVGRVQQGDVVLIYQGASCTGQMAIQLARQRGARVLVTAGTVNKKEFLRREFSIPDGDVLEIGNGTILTEVFRITKGRGIDIVFGAISECADSWVTDLIACLGPCGRLIDTSLRGSAVSMSRPGGKDLSSNISSSTINMTELMQQRPKLANSTFQCAMKALFDEALEPPAPVHIFAAAEAHAALSHFQDGEAVGKRVITLDVDTTISANIKTKPTYRFDADSTYVIGGGLGGLGRSIARWMVGRGARHLVLISRSGAKSDAAKALISELEAQGVSLSAPKVDLSDLHKVKDVLQSLASSMPPIKGCIQSATVLRDNLFPNMTYEDWSIGVESKAIGSKNLHLALPSGLDFFVLLASVNGIFGGRAQANYAAANTYQDSLAHHRISLQEKAVSIDLGLMVGEGIVAEDAHLLDTLRRWGQFMDVGQNELFALLDHYCDPSLPLLQHDEAQILVGVETAAAIRAKGVDIHHSFFRPMFQPLFRMDTGSGLNARQASSIDYASELEQAASDDAAGELLTKWFKTKLAQVLNLEEIDVDAERPVHTYGIDSLVAIDLKNWFAREIRAEVQVFALLGNKPMKEIARDAALYSRSRS